MTVLCIAQYMISKNCNPIQQISLQSNLHIIGQASIIARDLVI